MPRLSLLDVRKRYLGATPTDALRGVTLQIEQGDFVAIEGPSGGGKSTLLNVIGLLDEATSGDYKVGDTDTGTASPRALAELRSDRFAFIFQSFHLLDRRPVTDSVELALLYRAVPRAERRRLAQQALTTVGLGHLSQQTAAKLSGGERQRVAIARALATGAPIVVADEPTGNLDSDNSKAVVDSLRALNETGTTIVLVTHSAEVADAAPRRVKIRDGQLVDQGRPTTIHSGNRLEPPVPPGRASRLRARDLIADAFDSVRSRIARTIGLIAAVAVGVALAVATLGISVSAGAQVSGSFNAHTNRDVTAEWHPEDLSDQSTASRISIVDRLGALKGMETAGLLENYSQHQVQASPVRPSFASSVFAITPHTPAAARMTVTWARGHSAVLREGEILVGKNLADQLSLSSINSSPLLMLDERTVTVVGVITKSPRVPEVLGGVLAAAIDAAALGRIDTVQALLLTRAGAAQQVSRQAPLVVNPFRPNSVTINAPVDPTSVRAQIESDVQSSLLALTGIALLASIAGLANAMILSVIERNQEFGLRRALGARPRHIVGLVLAESTIIGAIGGVVGLAIGLAGILIITLIRQWSPVFDLTLAPLAIAGGIVVGAIGGILASARASRIQPNEALRL